MCSSTWWEGASIEIALDLAKLGGGDTSYLNRLYDELQQYLVSNCVGIGTRLASLAGASTYCYESLISASTISIAIQTSKLSGGGTYFLQFGGREVDRFLAAAGC